MATNHSIDSNSVCTSEGSVSRSRQKYPPTEAGNRSGRLTAIRQSRKVKNHVYWLYRCDCGAETEHRAESVRRGQIISCGCSRRTDYTGQKFGRLTAMRYLRPKHRDSVWLLRCDCGNEVERIISRTVMGVTASCGCLAEEKKHDLPGPSANQSPRHGMSRKPEWTTWNGMRRRCYNPSSKNYHTYGGRGIFICGRWRVFENFHEDMGDRPSQDHSIDRINNEGSYTCGHCEECVANGWPANCRWTTKKIQSRNKNNTRVLTYGGVSMPIVSWAETIGISVSSISSRLKSGWSVEMTIFLPAIRGRRLRPDDREPARIARAAGEAFLAKYHSANTSG